MSRPQRVCRNRVQLLLADVDGTLVTQEKVLTERTIAAVAKLRDAGILFAITSGRPPRGMSMLIEPLGLTTPIAAFNGGLFIRPDLSVIEQRVIADDVTPAVIEQLDNDGLTVWVYRGADWLVPDPHGPHVAREAWTVRFGPTPLDDYPSISSGVAKVVGVSDDHDAVRKAATRLRERFGENVSAATSQPYYVDVTHPNANKGAVVSYLSAAYDIAPEAIATIGDMSNDVEMFRVSGLSIAMGNASDEVKRAARCVTTSNEDDGFADAVEQLILP